MVALGVIHIYLRGEAG